MRVNPRGDDDLKVHEVRLILGHGRPDGRRGLRRNPIEVLDRSSSGSRRNAIEPSIQGRPSTTSRRGWICLPSLTQAWRGLVSLTVLRVVVGGIVPLGRK